MTRRPRPSAATPLGAGARMPVARIGGIEDPSEASVLMVTSARSGATQTLVVHDFPDPYDARCLSPNGRAHWATQAAVRKEVHSRIVVEATRSSLRPVAGPVRLTFRYVFPTRRRRDVDNLTSGVTKAAIDALVRGRWLGADDSENVVSVRAVPVVERGSRRLEIVIEEMPDA